MSMSSYVSNIDTPPALYPILNTNTVSIDDSTSEPNSYVSLLDSHEAPGTIYCLIIT
jgi:hypothetical protein